MNRVLTIAIVTAAALAVPRAAADVGYLLVTGERVRGVEVSMSAPGPETPNGEMNLQLASGEELNYDRLQVVLIEYVTGEPPASDLRALPHDPPEEMLVLRDGTFNHGRMVDLRPSFIRWRTIGSGTTENITIDRISRVYLNPTRAREIYNVPVAATDVAAPAAVARGWQGMQAGPITVAGNQAWTDTGLTVRRGERLRFSATGEVRVSPDRTVPPAGAGTSARQMRLPVPRLPIGGLIGKVDDNRPFAIGASTEPIQIDRNGRLWLGINDDNVADNSGAFVVNVVRGERQ